MDYITQKEDEMSKKIRRDFPNVRVTEITDSNIISVIYNNPYIFVDSRLNLDDYPVVCCALFANGDYNIIKDTGNGYLITYS